jgi:cephalosporin-C deacetylase-like acetyl esterase
MNKKILTALAVATFNFGACAMNLNLATPWGEKCSPPQKPELAFYSKQSDDMLFAKEKEIEIYCQAGLRSVGMNWKLSRNMFAKPFMEGTAEALPPNRFVIRINTANLHPGFYDLKVNLDVGLNKTVDGVCTFGFRAGEMPIRDTRPADFAKFWSEAVAKLAKIPLDAKESPMEDFDAKRINEYNVKSACLPSDYDPNGHKCEKVESCKVDFAGPDGGRVYGWLAKPEGKGPFPAMLILPGAGFAARPRPLEHARHGYLSLDIQVHGQEVDLKEYPKIPGYYDDVKYEPTSAYYYYNIHLRCLQAVNYLLSRPDVDPKRIVVVGGSQGGRLGIVVAGLDPRISAVVSCIANSPNHPHLRWVARCNAYADAGDKKPAPAIPLSDGMDIKGVPPLIDDVISRSFAYYDPMNYAQDIKCPVLMNGGLIDPVSPPFSVWAVYNRLGTVDKAIVAIDGHGHDWSAAFDCRAWKWLDGVLKLNPGRQVINFFH